MSDCLVRFTRTPDCMGVPAYKTAKAAGMDLHAAKPSEASPWVVFEPVPAPGTGEVGVRVRQVVVGTGIQLQPGQRLRVPVGVAIGLPPGFEAQVRPRSGLAWLHGLMVPNTPGTIDADYTGEVKVLLVNLGQLPIDITIGMRIAQLVVAPVSRAQLCEVDELDATERGSGGFGSTGV